MGYPIRQHDDIRMLVANQCQDRAFKGSESALRWVSMGYPIRQHDDIRMLVAIQC